MRNPTVKFGEDAGKIWQTLYEHSYLDEEKLLEITKLTDSEFHAGVGWLAREDKIAKKNQYGGVKTTEKTCGLHSRKISLNENLSGLVFNDEHFSCEDCCGSHSEEDLSNWTKTVMQNPQNGMPIALWLIHEQNKDKTMMTVRK